MAPRVISVFRSSEAVDGATYHEAEDYAAIPTDVDVSRQQAGGWSIPCPGVMVCDGVRCEVAFVLTRELTLKTNVTLGHVNDTLNLESRKQTEVP